MKYLFMTFIALTLAGCSQWTTKHDIITWPDGDVTHIQVAGDGVVTAKKGGMEVTADHRGRPSIPEQILGVGASALSNGVQVEVGQ